MTKVALVLSGGGARGAYQLGVWQALNELGVDTLIKAVYGTSVGAINGAAFVQGDFDKASDIWSAIDYHSVFKTDISIKEARGTDYLKIAKNMVMQGGADVSPLKDLLRDTLDESSIRVTGKDFGMVVFNMSSRKPEYRKMSDIPDGELIEYVIASSTFPIFQPHQIGEELFLDGGLYDNRPFDFIDEASDIDHIICVDVTVYRHIWKNKKPSKAKIPVTYIRPSRLLGSPMAFDNSRINRNIELGYNDAKQQLLATV